MPNAVARLEWPSGVSTFEALIAIAGRVEQQLNGNGDPVYIGYAPKADSRTDADGWIIEYRIYDASNKLLTIHRKAGFSWNSRTAVMALVHLKDIAPANAHVSMAGNARAVQYERGAGLGSLVLNQIGTIAYKKVKVARFSAASQIKLLQGRCLPSSLIRAYMGVNQLSMSATVSDAGTVQLGVGVLGQMDVQSTVRSGSYKGGFGVGRMVISATANGIQV
jgi:uncharacterized membrane protein YiaA